MAILSISRDNVVTAVTIASFIGLVVGLAALILSLRDRSRDRRGVPEWIRQRGQIKAKRVAVSYGILVFGVSAISLVLASARAERAWQTALLLISAAIFLWLLRHLFLSLRFLNRQIDTLNREHDVYRPHE